MKERGTQQLELPDVKERYEAALEALRRTAGPLLEAVAAQPVPSEPRQSALKREPELQRLAGRLRALGEQEVLPGLTGIALATSLTGQLEGLAAMQQLFRYLEDFSASLAARAAELEGQALYGAVGVLHEAKRLAQLPGSDLGPVVRRMEQPLRSQQKPVRGTRRRK